MCRNAQLTRAGGFVCDIKGNRCAGFPIRLAIISLATLAECGFVARTWKFDLPFEIETGPDDMSVVRDKKYRRHI
jgi:hypothetical protein